MKDKPVIGCAASPFWIAKAQYQSRTCIEKLNSRKSEKNLTSTLCTFSRFWVGSGVGFCDSRSLTRFSMSDFFSAGTPKIPLLIPLQQFKRKPKLIPYQIYSQTHYKSGKKF